MLNIARSPIYQIRVQVPGPWPGRRPCSGTPQAVQVCGRTDPYGAAGQHRQRMTRDSQIALM